MGWTLPGFLISSQKLKVHLSRRQLSKYGHHDKVRPSCLVATCHIWEGLEQSSPLHFLTDGRVHDGLLAIQAILRKHSELSLEMEVSKPALTVTELDVCSAKSMRQAGEQIAGVLAEWLEFYPQSKRVPVKSSTSLVSGS